MRSRARAAMSVLVVVIALVAFPVMAEEGHAGPAEHSGEAESHGEGGHQFKNAFALFLGATNEHGHGTEGTWGLEYARRLTPHWAVGGLIDYAGGDQRNMVIAPAVFWRPFGGGFYLLAAPGVEYHNGRGVVGHHLFKAGTTAVDEDESYFVMRLGVGYAFHVGSRYGIVPNVNLDLVDGHEVWVYGVNFEVMF